MSRFEEGVKVGKLQLIAENYYTNVIKPKVLKGEENKIIGKGRRLIPTAYREIIKEQQDKIDKAMRILKTLKGSARWERYLYEIDELINTLGGDE